MCAVNNKLKCKIVSNLVKNEIVMTIIDEIYLNWLLGGQEG